LQKPEYKINDIRHAANNATYDRALDLYKAGKVGPITSDRLGYSAIVQGTHPYRVTVSAKHVDKGDCDCYLGQNDSLCKHILALALAVLGPSGAIESFGNTAISRVSPDEAKQLIKDGIKKLRAYIGPSRVWFSYQRSLATGAAMIAEATRNLPPSKENADYLWRLIERLDKKLETGIDDSDGVLGNCIDIIISCLADYARQIPELEPRIRKFCRRKTGFGFEARLQSLIDKPLENHLNRDGLTNK
jgi:hypothetical protein